MRKNRAFIVFLIGFVMCVDSVVFTRAASSTLAAESAKSAPLTQGAFQFADVGYLENIVLESPVPKEERIVIAVSKLSGAVEESQAGNTVLIKLENMFIPQDFRRPFGEDALQNIIRVVPDQRVLEGKQWAYMTIDLKENVPYRVRREGQNILIDFNLTGLAEKSVAAGQGPDKSLSTPAVVLTEQKDKKVKTIEVKDDIEDFEIVAGSAGQKNEKSVADASTTEKIYTGHKISLDFQDASIKSVFRLLAELTGINIVSGEDVKGNVTIQMKNVPWDQALDTILSITGLGKKQIDKVIIVMTMEKIKRDEAEQAALEAKRKAEANQPPTGPLVTRVVNIDYTDAKKLTDNLVDLLPKDKEGKTIGSVKVDEHINALIVQATREDMNRLYPIIEKIDKPTPQVLIKANIVETTKDTARNLGIQWGGIYGHKVGDQGLYVTPGGTKGVATPGSVFSGTYTPAYGDKGVSGQGFGVNFPAAMSEAASASMGLMYGTLGGNILEVQLSALQEDGKLNILSSPSITTLDNQKAFTENGEKIPYVTTEVSGGTVTKTVKFENAVLRLEITPHVIDGKNLKMKILVQKDEVDNSRSVDGNPYIIKKQTETNLIVQDGETIVISGLTKQRKSEDINGIPFLKDIPILGWLFKGENKNESMEEVLIFITPNILKPQTVAGIQGGQ